MDIRLLARTNESMAGLLLAAATLVAIALAISYGHSLRPRLTSVTTDPTYIAIARHIQSLLPWGKGYHIRIYTIQRDMTIIIQYGSKFTTCFSAIIRQNTFNGWASFGHHNSFALSIDDPKFMNQLTAIFPKNKWPWQ